MHGFAAVSTGNGKKAVNPEHQVVRAGHGDMARVCAILGDAFAQDPVFSWLVGNPECYRDFFRVKVEALYKHHRHVMVNRAANGAAMWLPAGVSFQAPLHWRLLPVAWHLLRAGGVSRLRLGLAVEALMADHHCREPHFYLYAIGATRDAQGRGIGSALLKEGLSACDALHMPAYLESTSERNKALYQRHGFEEVGELVLPDGGPAIWRMERAAR